MAGKLIPVGEPQRLGKRKIHLETCEKYGYTISEYQGQKVQVANYRPNGPLQAQHLRFPDKSMPWKGDTDHAGLFGQHLWSSGGKRLIITEGEIDCLTVAQLFGLRWPVVSIRSGAHNAVKDITEEMSWVESFEDIVLMFDNDEAGRDAANEVAETLGSPKVRIATLPGKDANELHVEDRGKEVVQAVWQAKPYQPDGLLEITDSLLDEALKPVEYGKPWPWESLTELTYGRRRREMYYFGAGTGIGKTDTLFEIIEYDYRVHNHRSAIFMLETPPKEVLVRLAGKFGGKPFHIPNAGWDESHRVSVLKQLREDQPVVIYDSKVGSTDWDTLRGKIRYCAIHLGIKDIYIDHITALAASADDERKFLEGLNAELGEMVHKLDCTLYVVSHLATPDGTPHEEGGRVMLRHFKGSRSIGYWAHYAFGLERNTQAEDPQEKTRTTFRCLKDRYTGRANGQKFYMRLNPDTFRQEECEPPPKPEGTAKDYGFSSKEEPIEDF